MPAKKQMQCNGIEKKTEVYMKENAGIKKRSAGFESIP